MSTTMYDPAWKPMRSLKECTEIMTAPGQFLETEHAVIDDRMYRVYKNLWPSIRQYWLSSVSNNLAIRDQEYIVSEDTRLTYAQADELIQRAASVFREVYGVRKGDRVCIAMRNLPEWIIAFFAAAILGAVPTALNAWLPIEPIIHCIKLTMPKLLIVDSERLSLLGPHLPSLRLSVLLVRTSRRVTVPHVNEWPEALSSYTGSIKAWEKEPESHPDDNATIFFTSGTTGVPKGVLSTQRSFLGNVFNSLATFRRRELRLGSDLPPPIGQGPPQAAGNKPATLMAVPLFHVTACTSQLIISTATGSKIVLMRKWSKELAANLIREEGVTGTGGVPSIVYDLFESSAVGNTLIESLGSGGAPAADSLPMEIAKKFPNAMVQQGYGLSETNSIAVAVVGEDYFVRPSSTGLPPPVVDLLVVEPETNKVLPPGRVGELWIRGPNVMREYYNNPKATAETITRDGWLKSGDLASIDEEGFVYIKDRVKDMIIRGGENIHSAAVENALFADERLVDCAVCPIPDRRLGELVGAVVVPRMEWKGKVSEKDVVERAKPRLPAFAVPSMVLIQTEALERNAAGKVLKQPLRKILAKEWAQRKNAEAKL